MNFFKYNRTAAWAVLIAVIAAAIPVGAIRSVSALENKVEKIYESGNDRYGTARTDLSRLAEYGQNLLAITDSLGCADSQFDDALKELRAALTSPLADTDAVTAVMNAASLSYNRLIALPDVPEAQKNSAISYFYEMTSTLARLQNNEEYAKAAQKYNNAKSSFPASLFTGGKESAITFGR